MLKIVNISRHQVNTLALKGFSDAAKALHVLIDNNSEADIQ